MDRSALDENTGVVSPDVTRACRSLRLESSRQANHQEGRIAKATDWPDVPETRRRVMRAIRGKDTKPELLLRSMLHRAGYRFRLHRKDLPGRPDLAFASRRKVIEVRGCWWHRHEGCRYCTTPRTRQDYWLPKLARNQERDRANEKALSALGWSTLVIWECEMADPGKLLERAAHFLSGAREVND